ncbi:VWA domain-containing protein [bacterium]|nr:VWA domain-containing protein [bacterium]
MLGCSRPWLLILLPVLAGLWWWLGQRPAGLAAQVSLLRRRLSAGLRLLSLLCLALALAGLRQRQPSDRLCVTFLIDQSLSTRRQQGFIQAYVEKVLAARPGPVQVAVVHFAAEAVLELAPTRTPYLPKTTHRLERGESNLAAAVQYGAAAQPPGEAGRLVLISDGRQTRGDLLRAAQASALEVDTVALPDSLEPEVTVEELRCPSSVAQKTPFDLVATLASTQPVKGAQLQLFRQGLPVGRYRLDLAPGRNVFLLPQAGEKPGVLRYEARLSVDHDGERANNKGSGLTLVEGASRVALIHPMGAVDRLTPLLQARGLEVDSLDSSQLPNDVGEWLTYQAVILDNIPSTDLSSQQLESLAALVREAGVGLVMLGGPDSFAAGGYAHTALAEAMPVDLRVRKNLLTPPSAQLHVLDKSGSMGEVTQGVEHIAMAREASIAALEILTPEDQFGVIAFDDASKWVVPVQPVKNPKALAGLIATLRAGGGTDMFPALEQGVKALAASPLSSRHILILSDGATAPADFDGLAARAAQQRILISTVAVGDGADLVFLQRLAKSGKGRCYVADSAHALPRIFARETMLSSRSAFDERPASLKVTSAHPVLAGTDAATAPPLLGHNLVTAKGAPHRILLETQGGDPVLAVGRYGLGKTVAFTADDGRRWSQAWSRRDDFGQLLLQSLRWCLPQGQQGPLEVVSGLDSLQRLQVSARISPELAPQGLVGSLLAPNGTSQTLELVQMGPDRFEVRSEFQGSGTFVLTLGTPDGRIRVVQPVALLRSQELSGAPVQQELLRDASESSGGRFQPGPAQHFRKPRKAPVFYQDLQRPLLIVGLLALLLEVAARRLPWPGRRQAAHPVLSVDETETVRTLQTRLKRAGPPRRVLQLEEVPPESRSPREIPEGSAVDQLRKVRDRTRKKGP